MIQHRKIETFFRTVKTASRISHQLFLEIVNFFNSFGNISQILRVFHGNQSARSIIGHDKGLILLIGLVVCKTKAEGLDLYSVQKDAAYQTLRK